MSFYVHKERQMTEISQPKVPVVGWRLKIGIGLFGLSIALPVLGVPLLATMGHSAKTVATVSGVLLVCAEVFGLIAVAVMGKSGFAYIKNSIFGFLKKHGPPAEVSRTRYTIGLVMFSLPILFGWVSIYIPELIPGFTLTPYYYAIGGDLLLLASLIVLGGNFWDKVRALFIYDSEVRFKK